MTFGEEKRGKNDETLGVTVATAQASNSQNRVDARERNSKWKRVLESMDGCGQSPQPSPRWRYTGM